MNQILSSVMNLTRQYSQDSSIADLSDIDTIKYNYYHELRPKIYDYTATLYNYLVEQSTSIMKTQFLMVMLVIAEAIISIIFLFYFVWLKKRILKKKQDILFLFLDIPKTEVQGIFKKCDKFLNFCNVYSIHHRCS